jgi:hypothetical protein
MDGYDGFVHSGMLKSAKKISNSPVKQAVIEALNKYPTYSLTLCGHSLGGGVASLLTLLWSRETIDSDGKKIYMTNTEIGLPLRPIKCFVYVRMNQLNLGSTRFNVCPSVPICSRFGHLFCIQ